MPTPFDDALAELATRLEQQGIHARVYVHDGMMSAMTHRDGDTTATIDGALVDGTEIIEGLATEIADDRGLPDDWLAHLGDEAPHLPRNRLATLRERAICVVVRTPARLATRCVGIARQPYASMLKKRLALAGIRVSACVVKVARRFPFGGCTLPSSWQRDGS